MSTESKSRVPVALVTGAARRIGASIARTLHGRGCRVLIHYLDSADHASRLADVLNQDRPDSAFPVQADLTTENGPKELAARVREHARSLDLLVNNASRFYPTALGEVQFEDWKDLMGSNVRGPFFLCQELLGELQGGSVVNIVDIHARRPMAGHAVYNMAKAAVEMMTYSLARELAPGIRVNGVSPGAILWPETEPGPEEKTRILAKIAMNRLGMPEDIAGAVAFLGLDAPYVTGQVLAVDGGRSLNM